jgi:hypothetical protein
MRPGWTARIACCGSTIGTVRPWEWTGQMDANLESIRPVVTGARIVGLTGDRALPELSRKQLHQQWLRTTAGRAWLIGSRASKRDHEDAEVGLAAEVPDRWVGEFTCRACGLKVWWLLETLVAVATRRAEANDPEIALHDLSSLLNEVRLP